MIPQKTQRRVPTEGLDYQGHICHVLVNDKNLIISVLINDRDLTNYTADFWEKDPVRINQLTERVLQLCGGRASGLNESLLGQPVTVKRVKGRLQLRRPLPEAAYITIPGAEYEDSDFSLEILIAYPML